MESETGSDLVCGCCGAQQAAQVAEHAAQRRGAARAAARAALWALLSWRRGRLIWRGRLARRRGAARRARRLGPRAARAGRVLRGLVWHGHASRTLLAAQILGAAGGRERVEAARPPMLPQHRRHERGSESSPQALAAVVFRWHFKDVCLRQCPGCTCVEGKCLSAHPLSAFSPPPRSHPILHHPS